MINQREESAGSSHQETDPIAVVREYYRLVDDGDVTGLLQLFEPTAEYSRPGYEGLTGAALERFYRHERVIRTGRHVISKAIIQGGEVAVHGTFRGMLHNGAEISVRFADFFTVTPLGTFSARTTFFYTPLV
ncbi:nuclear transport factor 2 family protein [Streptomyces sp. R11]|uniref:Nuclear transport factor 2 family protein n=1 Tax=Streptomyces sp. R11 TaxID=3238625 RepID=A0AB39NE92_9ACTN